MAAVTAIRSAALMRPSQLASPGVAGAAVPVGEAGGVAVGVEPAVLLGVAVGLGMTPPLGVGLALAVAVRVGVSIAEEVPVAVDVAVAAAV